MTALDATPGQTVGPFFAIALPYVGDAHLVPPGRAGAISLSGCVFDGAGDPVPDALIELWQASADGSIPSTPGSLRRDGWTFSGWGRAATDSSGTFRFTTLRPGRAGPGAPYFALTVFARGLLDRLFTRAYLCDTPGVEHDEVLAGVPPERRCTLLTRLAGHGHRFDVHLQGEHETVFFEFRDRAVR